jgi:hypothetical protein
VYVGIGFPNELFTGIILDTGDEKHNEVDNWNEDSGAIKELNLVTKISNPPKAEYKLDEGGIARLAVPLNLPHAIISFGNTVPKEIIGVLYDCGL